MAITKDERYALMDKHRIAADFRADGFAVISEVISSKEVNTLTALLDSIAADELSRGVAWHSHGNQRVFNLIGKCAEFRRAFLEPAVLEAVQLCLGEHFLLSSLTANVALPGNEPQQLHADQGYLPEPWHRSEVVNCIWVLDAFRESNGATRYVPRSHVIGASPPNLDLPCSTIEADPGSVVLLDGRLWHGTGANTTASEKRRALFAYYCKPYIRQQENVCRSLPRDILRALTVRERTLLGFDIWQGLGAVDGLPLDWMDGRERIGATNSDSLFEEE